MFFDRQSVYLNTTLGFVNQKLPSFGVIGSTTWSPDSTELLGPHTASTACCEGPLRAARRGPARKSQTVSMRGLHTDSVRAQVWGPLRARHICPHWPLTFNNFCRSLRNPLPVLPLPHPSMLHPPGDPLAPLPYPFYSHNTCVLQSSWHWQK